MDPAHQREAARMSAEDIKRARAIEEMTRTEGWKAYQALMNEWVNQRMVGVLQPTPVDGALTAEHIKGTIYGIMMCRDSAGTIVDEMKKIAAATNSNSAPGKGKAP